MVLKQLGMASVSIQAGVEWFLELEPNSNTCFLSGRTVPGLILNYFAELIHSFQSINFDLYSIKTVHT